MNILRALLVIGENSTSISIGNNTLQLNNLDGKEKLMEQLINFLTDNADPSGVDQLIIDVKRKPLLIGKELGAKLQTL
jgi:hypothetical protein